MNYAARIRWIEAVLKAGKSVRSPSNTIVRRCTDGYRVIDARGFYWDFKSASDAAHFAVHAC